ncbi:hypothetical protein GQR58_029736 [Nymphon striatum]|nr:hypothetical protein GQR58_029736 [Nymphon striatum]
MTRVTLAPGSSSVNDGQPVPGVVLGFAGEERGFAHDALVGAVVLGIPVLAGEGPFGACVLRDLELLLGETSSQFLGREADRDRCRLSRSLGGSGRVRNLAEAVVAVAARVLGQVLLVVVLGVVEVIERTDLGRDLAEAGTRQLRLVGLAAGLGDDGLILGRRVHGGAILATDVVALAHELDRVVVLPEDLEQFLGRDDRRIKDDQHRFGVTGHRRAGLFVRGVRCGATGIASCGGVDAGHAPEEALGAPETAHANNEGLVTLGPGTYEWIAVDEVGIGDRHSKAQSLTCSAHSSRSSTPDSISVSTSASAMSSQPDSTSWLCSPRMAMVPGSRVSLSDMRIRASDHIASATVAVVDRRHGFAMHDRWRFEHVAELTNIAPGEVRFVEHVFEGFAVGQRQQVLGDQLAPIDALLLRCSIFGARIDQAMHVRHLVPQVFHVAGHEHGSADRIEDLATSGFVPGVVQNRLVAVAGERHDIHHCDVDVLADAGHFLDSERGHDADDAVHAGQHVGGAEADISGLRNSLGRVDQASFAVQDRGIGSAPGFGAVLAEAADRQHDDVGLASLERFVVEPVPSHDPGPEVLDDDVGLLDELQDQLGATRLAQVDADVLLADVLLHVIADEPARRRGRARVPARSRPDPTPRVRRSGRLRRRPDARSRRFATAPDHRARSDAGSSRSDEPCRSRSVDVDANSRRPLHDEADSVAGEFGVGRSCGERGDREPGLIAQWRSEVVASIDLAPRAPPAIDDAPWFGHRAEARPDRPRPGPRPVHEACARWRCEASTAPGEPGS